MGGIDVPTVEAAVASLLAAQRVDASRGAREAGA
jgi:hypothetical protein